MDDEFGLDYWTVAGALCRGLHEVRDEPVFQRVVSELERAYPRFDWGNVLTDSWPLPGTGQASTIDRSCQDASAT